MAEKRGRGARSLAAVLPAVAKPAARRRGFAAVEVITCWPEIVGRMLAAESSPERLSFPRGARRGGTLHVRATGALAVEIQHLEPVILERVNTYFGYGAVVHIALTQGPIAPQRRKVARLSPTPSDPAREAAIARRTLGIDDPALRCALNRLGTAVDSAAVGATQPGKSR